jgi:hypothetical protein
MGVEHMSEKKTFCNLDWESLDLEGEKTQALEMARQVYDLVCICDLGISLEQIAEAAIDREYAEIETNPERSRDTLHKLRRIKRRFSAFIEVGESLIEDLEFITGESVEQLSIQQRLITVAFHATHEVRS